MSALAWIPAEAILPFILRLAACVTVLPLTAMILALPPGKRGPAVRHAISLWTAARVRNACDASHGPLALASAAASRAGRCGTISLFRACSGGGARF